jgi:hypothetical protein
MTSEARPESGHVFFNGESRRAPPTEALQAACFHNLGRPESRGSMDRDFAVLSLRGEYGVVVVVWLDFSRFVWPRAGSGLAVTLAIPEVLLRGVGPWQPGF